MQSIGLQNRPLVRVCCHWRWIDWADCGAIASGERVRVIALDGMKSDCNCRQMGAETCEVDDEARDRHSRKPVVEAVTGLVSPRLPLLLCR